jgi:membrane-bound serine protease (ClpP class)
MLATWLLVLLAGVLLFELAEHVMLPLVLAWKMRRRRSVSGVEGMVGKVVQVRRWLGVEGQVMVDGELWTATCASPLAPGDRAVIRQVHGLVLAVERTSGEDRPAGRC